MSKVTRKRGEVLQAAHRAVTPAGAVRGRAPRPFRLPPERCPRCKEVIVGVRKCRCDGPRLPSMVWANGILRPFNGCDTCGSTLHSACSRTRQAPQEE